MNNHIIKLSAIGLTVLLVNYEIVAQSITQNNNTNTRLNDPNPEAWSTLPMEIVISDFQKSDGIFSSFICDEINKRIQSEPLKSLHDLDAIDKKSRKYAFKICFSPEASDSTEVLNVISGYSNKYPEVVDEIRSAAK